jgi:hypothetical protein
MSLTAWFARVRLCCTIAFFPCRSGAGQLQDLHSKLVLDHPRGEADQLHKCIASASNARGVFDGNVKVRGREGAAVQAHALACTQLLSVLQLNVGWGAAGGHAIK